MPVETFNTPGSSTWTCPANVVSVLVECWGGGGGGKVGNALSGSGGGGGGAYARKITITTVPGTAYAYSVGAGGGQGAAGGDTTFVSSTVVAKGGSSGTPATAGGIGGLLSGCVGDYKFAGGDGGNGTSANGGGGGGSSGSYGSAGGQGDNGSGGGGGAPGPDGAGGNGGTAIAVGFPGTVPGGGGGGSYFLGDDPGSGAGGKVKLTYVAVCTVLASDAVVNVVQASDSGDTQSTGASMAYGIYDLGDLVRVSAPFTTLAGAALDPTAVLLTVTTPSGIETTYTYGVGAVIVRDSLGNYHADINANAAGLWGYRWYSTGDGQAAKRMRFLVRT